MVRRLGGWLAAFGAALLSRGLSAEDLTLPAAASLTGAAHFFSDVRVFNSSYSVALEVMAEYRCFIGACRSSGGPRTFTLGPRESRPFDDVCVSLFDSPDSAGAIVFSHGSAAGSLVVTSRLYATDPQPTVGMFIPGRKSTDAHATSALTSIRNGGAGAGFRTNVGVFNGGDREVDVVIRIFDAGVPLGAPIERRVSARSGAQVSGVFAAAGAASHATENAVVVVSASEPLFAYAAVIDNATSDPFFIPGAFDRDAPAPGPVRRVAVGPGFQFRDEVEGGAASTISAGTAIEWVWEGGGHSTTSGPCSASGCTADGTWNSGVLTDGTFRVRFDTPGTFPYFCDPHSDQMRGVVIVSPP